MCFKQSHPRPKKTSILSCLQQEGWKSLPISFPFLPQTRTKKICRHKNLSTTALKTLGHGRGEGVIYGPLVILCARQHQCKKEQDRSIQNNTYIHTCIFIHTHEIQQKNFSSTSPNTSSRRPLTKIEIVKSKSNKTKHISDYLIVNCHKTLLRKRMKIIKYYKFNKNIWNYISSE